MSVDLLHAVKELREYERFHQIQMYEPYPKQLEFHHAFGKGTERLADQRGLIAANRVGKTFSAAMETAYHATGLYPEWWEGHTFPEGIDIVCAGVSNDLTRDIVQKALLGPPDDPDAQGSGTIPREAIVECVRKPGVPMAFQSIIVRHISGKNSVIKLMAYEQDWKKFMGISFDVGWCDEEPPVAIFSQFLRATTDRPASFLYLTFTPEEGITEVVDNFINDLKPGQATIHMTWDDAPHLTEDKKKQILAALPEHQRKMRSLGVPQMGSGLIFPVTDESISVSRNEIMVNGKIPRHWPLLCGIDFGSDHPFAGAWIAHDRDCDIYYIYDTYRRSRESIADNAKAIRQRDARIPVFWPHDGNQDDPASCESYAKLYRDEGIKMWWQHATNAPLPGKKEGSGGIGREAPLQDMLDAFESGRLKVVDDLDDFFEEKRMYHRKDGKVVALRDDIMSATRYAWMMRRHARVVKDSVVHVKQSLRRVV